MSATTRTERTAGPVETEALGAWLAERLAAGDVVAVSGELGAGKTTFVRGACRALGVTEPVLSPTFTVGRRYGGPVAVSHLDLYRLEGAGLKEEEPDLLADYITDDAISFVEWPGIGGEDLGPIAARVRLQHAGGDQREVTIELRKRASSNDRS